MTPEEWIASIPWVTKRIFFCILATTLLLTCGIISNSSIALVPPLILQQGQIWRLFTSYFFFGPLSLPFLFAMGLLLQYGRSFEGEYYAGNSGRKHMDFIWTLFLGWIIFTPLFLFVFPLYFPGGIMVNYVGYLWSRRDPFRPISVYGFTLKAWHTPLVFIFFDLIMQSPLLPTILAIFVGHFVHCLQNLVPQRYGVNPLKCPQFLLNLGDKWLASEGTVGTDSSPVNQAPAAASPPWAQGGGRRFQ